jgi:hypothetical protein
MPLVRLKIPDNAEAQSYAVIALLPNITSSGKILLIEGLTMEGTDGAIEFLARPPSCAQLERRAEPVHPDAKFGKFRGTHA